MALLLTVDPGSGVPVYRQLLEQIRFLIAGGVLAPGAELPSTRALSTELGINPMTVSKTYSLLEEEGLLTRRPGLPLVVRRQDDEAARQARREQLRSSLTVPARKARQLEVGTREALAIFEELLQAGEDRDPSVADEAPGKEDEKEHP